MKKAYITTLGCKVNQFESAAFITAFEEAGVALTHVPEEADIIVVNTCTVTNKAGAESRREVRKTAKANHRADLVITGCHAQLAADILSELDIPNPDRICIIGSNWKGSLVTHILDKSRQSKNLLTRDLSHTRDISKLPVRRFGSRTRAYLRVQDGCNSFCSYCIVPYTRGPSRSLPKSEVIEQALRYQDAGHCEVVVTGIHVGKYGNDLEENIDIADLLQSLCETTPDIRYRLSSIEPLEISRKLLTIISEIDNLMPHLHIPLQSGDNEILRRMNRRYNREQFASIINDCRTTLPDAAIGIDVLVGFPGETDILFNNTKTLLEELDCTYLHVFPYSKRPGTIAADMDNQIEKQTKNNRVNILRKLSTQKKTNFYRRHCSSTRPVLIENERDRKGRLKGFTDNYIPVITDGDDSLKNTIVTVELSALEDRGVRSTITTIP